jgi:hypothetical protein
MGGELAQLWRGELPLARALIGYALIYGLAVNLLISGVALVAYIMTSSSVLLMLLHFAAVPYNILASVGAWRSIDRLKGRPELAAVARISVVGIFAVLLLI